MHALLLRCNLTDLLHRDQRYPFQTQFLRRTTMEEDPCS
jgi:hypothetical protein